MTFERIRSAGYLSNWAARLFAQAIDRELKPLGLSSGQMPVFFALKDGAALTQKELIAHASIEQPTMAATLKRMEAQGIVVRAPDLNDKRSTLVRLTPKALELAKEVSTAGKKINAIALAGLSADEQDQLQKLMRGVIGRLETHLDQ